MVIVGRMWSHSGSVTIKEELMSLDTYDYSKSNPVPFSHGHIAKIFPYFQILKVYEHTSNKEKLESKWLWRNDILKSNVLPEIGGKVGEL